MNILIATDGIYPYSMGGSHRLIYEACRLLHAQGHRITCLVPALSKNAPIHYDGPEKAKGAEFGIVRFPINARSPFSKAISYFRGYRKPAEAILGQEAVEVINVHYLPALFSLRHLQQTRKIHYTFHGPWAGEFRSSVSGRMEDKDFLFRHGSRWFLEPMLYFFASRIEGWLLRKCHRFMVLSEYMKTLLVGVYGIDPEKIMVIPSGVNRQDFFPEEDVVFRKSLGTQKSMVFLTIRRLEKRMGLDILIKACAILRRDFDDFVLMIGGKGVQFDYLQGLIRAHHLEENVRMLGFVPETDLRKLLSLANLFILPSRDLEGFGLVVLESMACGTPVLVSPRGGGPGSGAHLR